MPVGGCSIFGAPLRASKCLSTLQCQENLTFLWVLFQVSKRTSTIKASTFDPRLSVFLQEKHGNRKNRSGTSTQQNDTADKSSTKSTTEYGAEILGKEGNRKSWEFSCNFSAQPPQLSIISEPGASVFKLHS